MPVCVEEFIADIATVFAFSLSELSQMSLIELIEWRERARGDEVELSSGDKFFP
ncbi:GpE family phage tail protein [Stenotrophomonas rhizophila]|uniref:GpE family phage tail protein n=1 Tax=Stenotrophomonas rhizophila TaxID=216778 RepID=UPI0021B492F1|nr:GpE family phage tail protein [Stenotrophomonas rhizophila]